MRRRLSTRQATKARSRLRPPRVDDVPGPAEPADQHGVETQREAGKVGLEGKNYTVQDGDIMLFRFNV